MRPFETIVMVDWSGAADTGATPRPDAIWAATVAQDGSRPPLYLRSLAAAELWLGALIEEEVGAGRRLLLGFDFPFGLPTGMAQRIAGRPQAAALWEWFAQAFDALGPDETRFHVAAALNALFVEEGPFWFNGLARDVAGLPRRKPAPPQDIPARRAVERLAPSSFACWQMGGAGAVGSQAMTGMACLGRLRRRFGAALSVWPFETAEAPVTIVEIWPTLLGPAVMRRMAADAALPRFRSDPVKDAAQVQVLAETVWHAQRTGRLGALLAAAPVAARGEEGWILGVGAPVALADLAAEMPAPPPLAPPPLADDCFALPPGVAWTPVDAALDRLKDRLRPVTATETTSVGDADGRILAADAVARRSNPPGANSAVDGYGFAHSATGSGPQILSLVAGRAAAGAPFAGPVPPGSAVRILTGALLPEGVDSVVLDEDTRRDADRVAFRGPVKPNANTRRAGEDVVAGDVALSQGHVLRPPDLALLAALGLDRVAVRARLRVGVLSTGDELAPPGSTDDPSRTFDANRPMLLALLRRWGHDAVDLGHVGDDRPALAARLDGGGCDAVLTSGGASAGDEDHVSALLRDAGSLAAWRIALKPGRPLALGVWNGAPVFGLPGNPVAAFVCALIFARPALSRLAGGPWCAPETVWLPAAFDKRKKAGRREYLRARTGPEGVEIFASEGSGRISGLSWATGLVELDDGAERIARGDPVRFLPYSGFGLG